MVADLCDRSSSLSASSGLDPPFCWVLKNNCSVSAVGAVRSLPLASSGGLACLPWFGLACLRFLFPIFNLLRGFFACVGYHYATTVLSIQILGVSKTWYLCGDVGVDL